MRERVLLLEKEREPFTYIKMSRNGQRLREGNMGRIKAGEE